MKHKLAVALLLVFWVANINAEDSLPLLNDAWQGPREIRNLRWVGGEYKNTSTTGAMLSPEDFKKNFNDAIKKSLEQEKLNGK